MVHDFSFAADDNMLTEHVNIHDPYLKYEFPPKLARQFATSSWPSLLLHTEQHIDRGVGTQLVRPLRSNTTSRVISGKCQVQNLREFYLVPVRRPILCLTTRRPHAVDFGFHAVQFQVVAWCLLAASVLDVVLGRSSITTMVLATTFHW